MTAILFGSISTLADTSELQRESFNAAFTEHGLDWQWSRDDYVAMLEGSGGRDRISAYADERGEQVDADAVHATKSSLFQQKLADADLAPRDGVVETIEQARADGLKVALVTTTSPDNVAALKQALSGSLPFDRFDLVVDTSHVSAPKPDAAAYTFALQQLGEEAGACVAIEDNLGGVAAARAAGIACVAFPNVNTEGHDFDQSQARSSRVELSDLRDLLVAS